MSQGSGQRRAARRGTQNILNANNPLPASLCSSGPLRLVGEMMAYSFSTALFFENLRQIVFDTFGPECYLTGLTIGYIEHHDPSGQSFLSKMPKRLCAAEAIIRGFCRERCIIALWSDLKARAIPFGRHRYLNPQIATKECGGLFFSGLLKTLAPVPLGLHINVGMHPDIHLENPMMRVAETIGARRYNVVQQQYFNLNQYTLEDW